MTPKQYKGNWHRGKQERQFKWTNGWWVCVDFDENVNRSEKLTTSTICYTSAKCIEWISPSLFSVQC